MTSIKFTRVYPIAILLGIILVITVAKVDVRAEVISGIEIMTKVDQREDGDDQVSRAVFELVNKRGQKRVRDTIRLWKDYSGHSGFDAKMITFFESPPDIKGTGFLSYSYWNEKKDDDQWLYLPALRKVRRIAASKKGDAFMGTDFTYDDMGERKIEEDHHKLIKSDKYNNIDCYVVESIPLEKRYIYSKKHTWVDKQNWIPLKVDYYDRKGRFLKTLNTDWQQVDGIWTWEKSVMQNHLTGHKTIIEIEDIELNTGLSEKVFTERTLKKGYKQK